MKMLTKFESKSSRAKGVAFHPTRPWVLVGLHLSIIQLWDYRMGTLIDRFEDHEGPVRCVNFHPTQPLFVSGSDDYSIKVWSLASRKCNFTLTGHLDYLRNVSFHHDLPWIVSCSDDQTIRIWNWQNRQEIACLTGHNHYVLLAHFHPSEDLIVSASLDLTVRVWDISGLRKKHLAPSSQQRSFEDQMQRRQLPQQDIFGNVNAVVKYVLEGHDKGVNWAAFHPSLPLIVSAGDDRLVKLWRMSDTKAWEVDTCRGHTGNVICAVFHPRQDLILSASDDRTIRVWDLNKRTPVKQFRRENDRFWMIANHPSINLFAACHDSGVMVFKLDRERPAHTLFQNKIYYVNEDKQVQSYDVQREERSMPILSLKKIGKSWSFIKSLSYNQFDNTLLVTHGDGSAGMYALMTLPKHATGAIEPTDVRLGEGNFACFILRNRFVSFLKESKVLSVKDTQNTTTKSIQLDLSILDVLNGNGGRVILVKSHSVTMYDVQQKKELNTLSANNVKYASWSCDGQYIAMFSKHTITIANKELQYVTSLHETIRVKSVAWDESGVLLYSTLNHVKYTLLNGDNGLIKTLKDTLYLAKVSGTKLFCLNRLGQVEIAQIDPTEYRFKRALVNKNFGEVLRIIKTSNLVGQNIIAYIQKKGYSEIALEFVQDPETRFELALECGDLKIAENEASKLDTTKTWKKLADEALLQGNVNVVERAYQKLELFDKLSFLYLCKGDNERLNKMTVIANARLDPSALLQNAILSDDVDARITAFSKGGLLSLAYALAVNTGRAEIAEQLLLAGEPEDLDLGAAGAPLKVPTPVGEIATDWPLEPSRLTQFETAFKSGSVADLKEDLFDDTEKDDEVSHEGVPVREFDDLALEDADAQEDSGWDMGGEDLGLGDDLDNLDNQNADDGAPVVDDGSKELAAWIRNSKTAARYVAAGAFDKAASVLNKQLGVVDFEPLRKRFMEVYTSNKLFIPGTKGLPAMRTYVRASDDADSLVDAIPYIPGFDDLDEQLSVAFKHFRANSLEEAITTFRKIIYTIAVITVDEKLQVEKCLDVLDVCYEYILGLSIELERRSIETTDAKRNLELAAYFTQVNLQRPHRVIALQVAMLQSFKLKNYSSASYFASELLKILPTGPKAEQAKKIRVKADSVSSDAIDIDFDPDADFSICCGSFTPIYKGEELITEALVGAVYKPEFKGQVCRITVITSVGTPASGLRIQE